MEGTFEVYGNTIIYSPFPTDVTQEELQILGDKVLNLENRQTLFIDYWQVDTPVSPLEGDLWFDNTSLSVYNNSIWILIPFSTDSVYVDRNTNQQYSYSGSEMVSMTVPLTKVGIETLVYSPKLTIAALNIDLSFAEVFEKVLTGATTFTISNPKNYKAFRIKLSGGSLNNPIFSGYTETWIASTLRTDYVSAGSVLYCEIQEANKINLFWGE